MEMNEESCIQEVTVDCSSKDSSEKDSQKIKLTAANKEISGIPSVQKIKIGEIIQADIKKLFTNIVGNEMNLKHVSAIDSNLKEELIKIPVTVYDVVTTVSNDSDNMVVDANVTGFTIEEVTSAIQDNQLDGLILKKVKPKLGKQKIGKN
ncbi:hypothetical protein [Carnobacterium maltaromaticum]|uniref:hypothetical protein n=1 Tax=Carnobacterium maltaromaticum TaxID=2751 RepID=UPI00295ED8ED|nr:hypothetical protein [Carnobacterium maltaromaticum]